MNQDERGLHVHMSDLKTWHRCPEQLRLSFLSPEPSNSDAAWVGTSTHGVIEHELESDEPYGSLAEAQEFAAWYFLNGLAEMEGTYTRSSFKTDAKAMAALRPLVASWFQSPEREMLMGMERSDYLVEYEFDEPFTVTPQGLVIFMAGRMDLIHQNVIDDWKTASSMQQFKQWELQRWDPQSTVYTWAAAKNGLIVPDKNGEYTFRFKVLVRKTTPVPFETVTVKRTVASWTWLERQVQNMAVVIDKLGFDTEWPLHDTSALCSGKWCPFFSQCKGQYIGEDWT